MFAAFVGNFSNFVFIGSGGFVGLFDTRFSIWTFVSGHEPSPSIVVFSLPLADNALTKGILNN